MENCELLHYGILGMKWGVRRTPEQLARARGKPASSSSKSDTKKTTKKKASEMSDEELNKAVRRLQLEKQYRDLNPETVSRGKKFVDTLMKQVIVPAATEAGKQVLKDYLVKAGTKALENSAKKAAKAATKKK